MTKKELIELLKDVPDGMQVTKMREDFPRRITGVEIIDAYEVGDHYWQSYDRAWDEEDGQKIFKIAVLEG